jgi:hypothetical protein
MRQNSVPVWRFQPHALRYQMMRWQITGQKITGEKMTD